MMPSAVQLFTPPHLQRLGYMQHLSVQNLANAAIDVADGRITPIPEWQAWRGILDYLSCVEFSRASMHQLPTGRAVGSEDVIPARYHSTSLIFLAQATLDNVAVWYSQQFSFQIQGSDCALHKGKFKKAATAFDSGLGDILLNFGPFLDELEKYRRSWIHKLTGGAQIFSNMSPSDPDAQISIAIPMNPDIDPGQPTPSYLRMIESLRRKNGGRWLYDCSEFANKFADGTRDLVLAMMNEAVRLKTST
jgi:hypothetical protein